MKDSITSMSRRNWLKTSGALISSLATIPVVIWPALSWAANDLRNDLHYQAYPREGHRCADCTAFIVTAGEGNTGGTCRVLAGPVSADGWCMAFSRKDG